MPYILVRLAGGLGNQLFELANAHQLSIKYNRTLLICDENEAKKRGVYWDTLFRNFSEQLISIDKFSDLKKKSKLYNWASYRFHYKDIVLDTSHEYYCIEGFYQSYRYFDVTTFEPMLHFETVGDSVTTDDIAVHIRRTDYLQVSIHKSMKLDYYYNALEKMFNDNPVTNVYIFSDDIHWCKDNFKYKNIVPIFVEMETDVAELTFMREFKRIIMANSTFSWWGAYLNGSDKKVICPQHWFSKGCNLITSDLRPSNWDIIDDDLVYSEKMKPFDKDTFNIISLGSACCMKQNIHDNVYRHLGPLFRQKENATDFFDWLICDFKSVLYIFGNLMLNDDVFLGRDTFTFDDIQAESKNLRGGWSKVYKKVELKQRELGTLISLHDVKKENLEVPDDFFDKYKRRFGRMLEKIKNNNTIHFTHCFDFQWLPPYFPTRIEIVKLFEYCKIINPMCQPKLHLFVHPKYHNEDKINSYIGIDNVRVCFLKNKGFHSDWKADNLTFDEFIHI